LVQPPVADQFPIISYQHSFVGIGNDWAVLKAGPNNLGQTPVQRYGQWMPIASSPASVGAAVGIWAYGMDATCINNQRQQHSSGSVSAVGPTTVQFSADLRAGASGTGVVQNNALVGVATNCSYGCANIATAVNLAAFAAARLALCPCTSQVVCTADVNGDHLVGVTDLLTVLGNWGPCPFPPVACVCDVALVPPMGTVDVSDLLMVINNWGACP
jgi:hypothetical protein